MRKMELGQAHCKDILNNVPKNFTLYFSELHPIFYELFNIK
jgi:hypothetical protein